MELPIDFIDNKYKNQATELMAVTNLVFNERCQNMVQKVGFKL
jgi:hypothetical protein